MEELEYAEDEDGLCAVEAALAAAVLAPAGRVSIDIRVSIALQQFSESKMVQQQNLHFWAAVLMFPGENWKHSYTTQQTCLQS